MSAPHRCHECGHKPGPRGNNATKSSGKKDEDKRRNLYKKAGCGCACHD